MEIKDDIRCARIRAVLWVVGFVALFSVLTWMLTGCARIKADDKAPGQPLDAHSVTEYDRPAWLPACDHAYKVTDSQTGQQWWLLVMNESTSKESYVCMPIEGSK